MTWTSSHEKARRTMFAPMRVVGGPKDHKEVGEIRTTDGVYVDGTHFHIVDDWRRARQPHRETADAVDRGCDV